MILRNLYSMLNEYLTLRIPFYISNLYWDTTYKLFWKKYNFDYKILNINNDETDDSIIFEHNKIDENKDWIIIVLGGPFNNSNSQYLSKFLLNLYDNYNIGIANHRGINIFIRW